MFEIVTTGPKWLTATVWDENALSNHDLCGRAYIRLDPNAFQDFVSQVSKKMCLSVAFTDNYNLGLLVGFGCPRKTVGKH